MLKKRRSYRSVSFLILLTFIFTIIGPSFSPSVDSPIQNSAAIKPNAIHTGSHASFEILNPKTASAATNKTVRTASVNPGSTARVSIKTLAPGTKYATELYVIKSGKPGPTVMFIGGVHGNETAGYKAAQQLTKYRPSKGTLLVIPQANKRAIAANRRTAKGDIDLNRAFPTTKNGSANGTLAKAILKVMKDYQVDWVMDMHEGYDYAKNTSNSSVGQSVIYYPSKQMTPLAKKIVFSLNTGIKYKSKQFSLLKYPVKGSASRCAAVTVGANSFIFESCSKETLNKRINNQLKAANILLNHLGMN